MNSDFIKGLLTVHENDDKGIWWQFSWSNCNNMLDTYTQIAEYSKVKEQRKYAKTAQEYLHDILVEGSVKVLIVNGDLDYFIPYQGTEKVLKEMKWSKWNELYGEDDFEPIEWGYENLAEGGNNQMVMAG